MNIRENLDLAALIIGYSRPAGIANLLDRLNESGVRNVYISIDGPKNIKDKLAQDTIKQEIADNSRNTCIKVLQRDLNLGAAAGVISAIDWFFSHEKMGVILEDDLQISEDFCAYAKNALDKYVNDDDVWMVSGTQHFPNFGDSKKTNWSNYPMVWGWAGWSHKWEVMRPSLLKYKTVRIRNLLDSNYLFWAIGANRALGGKIDAWDIPLAFEFKSQKKLSLLPPVNLISNVGNDEFATNTRVKNRFMHQKIQKLSNGFQYSEKPLSSSLLEYNVFLEKKVFNISKRHILLPYYSFFLDFIRFPKSNRKKPLKKSLENL
jgi:hypothetical protein